MRLAGPDVVLFLVGALLFSGATAAIVTREGGVGALGGGGSALGVYTVTYNTEESAVGEAAAVASFASGEASFVVNSTDVSRVIVVVDCNDPVPGPAAFTLTMEVTPPEGSNITVEPQQVACGDVEVPIDVAEVPSDTAVRGSTPDEARQNLSPDANATKAQGTWTVRVTGSRGAAPTLPVPGSAPSGTLALKVETWEPAFTPVQK